MEPIRLEAWGVRVVSPRSQKIRPCVLDMLVQKNDVKQLDPMS